MNIHFWILVVRNRQNFTNNVQELKLEFAPDGVDFYWFKYIRCLPIPEQRKRSKLSTFYFYVNLNGITN